MRAWSSAGATGLVAPATGYSGLSAGEVEGLSVLLGWSAGAEGPETTGGAGPVTAGGTPPATGGAAGDAVAPLTGSGASSEATSLISFLKIRSDSPTERARPGAAGRRTTGG